MSGKRLQRTLLGGLVAAGLVSGAVNAQPVAWDTPGTQWYSQQSEHFTVHFVDGHQQSAAKVLDIAEQVRQDQLPYFQSAPGERTEIVMVDDFDVSNGWATPLPFAQMRLFMSPPEDGGDLATSDDWLHMLIRHEFAHVMHMEMAEGTPEILQNIFGRQGLLFPHALTPSMLLEGLAVYLETSETLGYGRLQSSQYAMKMRMEVAGGEIKDLNQVVVADREWPLGYQYLYGAYFVQYLNQTYGEQKVQHFLQSYSRQIIPYFLLNRTARTSFGVSFDALWQDFQQQMTTQFSPQLAQLRQQAVTGQDLQLTPFLQVVTASDDGLLVNRNNGDDRPEIMLHATPEGDWQRLTARSQVTALDVHSQGGLLASRRIDYADGRSYNDLFLFRDEAWQQLTERQRFREMHWLPNGQQLIASRKVTGISELWRLDADASSPDPKPSRIWRGEPETVLGTFDIAPDGRALVAAVKRPLQGWNLERFDLTTQRWEALTDTRAAENSPHYLPDGRVMFSADYDGVFNIYVLAPDSGQVTQWTREVGGAFRPVWQPGHGLVYQAYTSDGYQLRYLTTPTALSEFSIDAQQGRYDYPPAVTAPAAKEEVSDYSPWSTLRPRNWLPVVAIDDMKTLLGAQTFGSDALGRHTYQVLAAWDVDNELGDLNAIYQYDNRWLFSYSRSHDFDKLTQGMRSDYRITREDELLVQRDHLWNAFEDQLSLHAGVVLDKEKLISQPDFAGPYRDRNETLTGLALTFDNREAYLNVPGVGWGHAIDLVAETNDLLDSDFEGQKYQARWQGTWDLPGRTTVTARLAAGYADDEAKRFRLGGNDLFEEAYLFGRDTQALRGYDESVQVGHRYATQRLALETWLARVERNWSLYPVGLGDISGNLFVDSGAAWDSGSSKKQLTGVGAELTLEAKLGYQLTLPVTLGYARGLDSNLGEDKVYFSIVSRF
ncbi:hypothetical protein [Photobacterium sp. TY1-4]|uniref:hypothetical protein n=1 Tax=Photobacterium sp. TY1-4 TaxID=2899122 RepID=UPI0021BF5B25|nr:hypothetical protein [Photobacterium sp. TY1-4]UXI03206.1 hypothetical protein NH461_22475 [Photobacterium sp. TY1-4]